jgi:drug/metabolite transporter (DMT)-like permease
MLLYALLSNFFFALGSQFFTHFSKKVGSIWMNWYKASIAQIFFILWLLLNGGIPYLTMEISLFLLTSGVLGLGLGDIFLLAAFKEIGPGRTLMLFAFQPLLMGFGGHLFFGQGMETHRLWAIIFFILCVLIISLENFKSNKHWGVKGISLAFAGMVLDVIGVMITRYSYEASPELEAYTVNVYRTFGALAFFWLLSFFKKDLSLFKPLKRFTRNEIIWVSVGSIFGTFLSLTFYLMAIQKAHLGSLSGIAITATLFSALFECLWEKKRPSRYLLTAFLSFLIGMKILVL